MIIRIIKIISKKFKLEKGLIFMKKNLSSNNPDPIDVKVGEKLRFLRVLKGLSQGKLAEKVGITFQQIQKYEKGVNRIAPSRLDAISRALDVNIMDFFDESEKNTSEQNLSLTEAKVLKNFRKLAPSMQQSVINLLDSLSKKS